MTEVGIFLLLLGGHYLADFPLQSEHIAANKGKVFKASIGFHCLTAHAAIHGLLAAMAMIVLGRPYLVVFLVIAVSHWLIDFGKSWQGWPDNFRITQGAKWAGAKGLYGINIDQLLHVGVLVGLVAIQ